MRVGAASDITGVEVHHLGCMPLGSVLSERSNNIMEKRGKRLVCAEQAHLIDVAPDSMLNWITN